MLKKQCFIYFSSVSHEKSVNPINRCHYSRYRILTNRSTRVLPSTTIRRIPQFFLFQKIPIENNQTKTRDKTEMEQSKLNVKNRELNFLPKDKPCIC